MAGLIACRGGRGISPKDELSPIGDPALRGEHNRDVCAELGFNEEEIDEMVQAGALVAPSAATRWS